MNNQFLLFLFQNILTFNIKNIHYIYHIIGFLIKYISNILYIKYICEF